ncbi:MAG TPA: hypothetical protein VKP00_02490 [Gemmatimonadaceae bacterium]|nr:hypothetical protein [Gemmatimonadaceae bacterium]
MSVGRQARSADGGPDWVVCKRAQDDSTTKSPPTARQSRGA